MADKPTQQQQQEQQEQDHDRDVLEDLDVEQPEGESVKGGRTILRGSGGDNPTES